MSENKQELIVKDQAFLEMDRKDDQQILASINDYVDPESAKQLFYSFQTKGKHGHKVEALSKQGVDECVLHMLTKNQVIREDNVNHETDPASSNHRLFTAKASLWFKYADKDGNAKETLLSTAIGTKRQEIINQWGKSVDFWFEFGTQKALRNAKSKLIPINVKQKIISMAKNKQQQTFIKQTQQKQKSDYIKFVFDESKFKRLETDWEKWNTTVFPVSVIFIDKSANLVKMENPSWEKIEHFPLIKKSNGKIVNTSQYMHNLENYPYVAPNDPDFTHKCNIIATRIRELKEQQKHFQNNQQEKVLENGENNM